MSKRYDKNRRQDGTFYRSKDKNEETYLMYYNRLMALSISRFEWVNLPEEIDERFLELTLFTDGRATFFYDSDMGNGEYLALKCVQSGGFDVYNRPLKNRAIASNGYNKALDYKDSVIIYNDVLRNNSMLDASMYAGRMYELERTIDVNIKAQKTPVMVLCNDNQRLVMENLYMKYDGNQPFLFGDKNLDISGVTSLKTDAPLVADKLQILKSDIWQEALSNMGIANINDDKKERLITSEVEVGNANVNYQQNIWLNARRQACEQINKMFSLNVSVKFREKEVEKVGEVYSTGEDDM